MDNKKRIKKPNPAQGVNPISSLFLWYTREIFVKSNRRDLTFDDVYDPLKSDESDRLGNLLEREWNHELEKRRQLEYALNSEGKKVLPKHAKPSLTKALMRVFFWQNAWLALIQALNYLVLFVAQPIFLGWVLDFFKIGENVSASARDKALLYTTWLILVKLGNIVLIHHGFRTAWILGMRMRVACCALIYRKTLRLNKSVLDLTAAGQVVNLMSNDVSRFDQLFMFFNSFWITPIQIILIISVMWNTFGLLLLIGIFILVLIALPLQSIVIFTSRMLRSRIAILTDKRVQLMSELVAGIQVVKMYAWEKPFEKIVNKTRIAEMKKIAATSHVRSIFFSSMVYSERSSLLIILVLYVIMGNHLTADASFVLATYMNILQFSIMYMMPSGLIAVSEVSVSIKRIQDFLLLDEIVTSNGKSAAATSKSAKQLPDQLTKRDIVSTEKAKEIRQSEDPEKSYSPVEINFHRVSANWVSAQLPPTLHDLSFRVEAGSLCALAGMVGSGKSAVLNLLLRELSLGAGIISLRQNLDEEFDPSQRQHGFHADNANLKVSYASQDAWLFSGTIRENILFGQEFHAKRYNEVTEVCALHPDFEQLSKGDLTVVGERGSSLSGGQRARVNLARAVYRQADIYLFDDPLSAVDPKVARHLFERCIKGYLHGKTRILVTHQLQFLRSADSLVFLERGSVKYHGSYENITDLNPKIMDMLKSDENKQPKPEDQRDDCDTGSQQGDDTSIQSIEISGSEAGMSSNSTDEEDTQRKYSNLRLFKIYFRAGGSWCLLAFYALVLILTQATTSGTDYWLSYWVNIEDIRGNKKNRTAMDLMINKYDPIANVSGEAIFTEFGADISQDGLLSTFDAIYVYAIILVVCTVFCLLRNYLIVRICMRASRRLHKTMFTNLLHATMNFFNNNPSGRILNRFSKDTGAMDEQLSRNLTEAVQIFSVMIGILCLIIVVNPWMCIPIVIIVFLFWIAKTIYLNAAQNIKKLESAAKSPVLTHVNASLNGLTTIRSCGRRIEDRLVKEFDRYQDEHTGTNFLTVSTNVAFGFFLDFLLVIFYASIAYSFVLLNAGNILGGNVGLALSQASILTGMVQYGFRLFVEVMSQLTSVERIIEYTNLPKEHPLESANPLPDDWPRRGKIVLKDVSMSYGENQSHVLKNLNITIEAGWKVGIVGRTGAGKSSIIAALFRLTGDGLKGAIKIDAVDTASIGLQDLRARISIIPQEPVLFTESLRYNLDPFGQYDDALLWEALREVELNELSLDQQVAEKGSNFSAGQRQLICLARAIVRRNLILVLDEATANIDTHTDAIIQSTIRKRFAQCTVLTVAHRLNTIIDSDRIIVMDNGSIVEFGCPYELLRNKSSGYFAKMVSQTGKVMSRKLEKLAEQACLRNTQQISLDISENSGDSAESTDVLSDQSYDIRL